VFAKRTKEYPDKAAYEADVLRALRAAGTEWVILAGYMRIVGPTLLDAYPDRILNIHPSLLPQFPGRTAVADALAAGVTETGVTVHLVDAGIDTGPVLEQVRVPIDPGMTLEALLERVHAAEHQLYPRVIRRLLTARRNEAEAVGVDDASSGGR
jgi:phosphoribosylglycinamide formyltransferase-1